jgi:membrane-anchored glycerophosphoryl diester phosphodiesterase (GDPDase)
VEHKELKSTRKVNKESHAQFSESMILVYVCCVFFYFTVCSFSIVSFNELLRLNGLRQASLNNILKMLSKTVATQTPLVLD